MFYLDFSSTIGNKQSKCVLPNQSQSARGTAQVGGEQLTPSGSNVSQQTSVSGTMVTPQQTQVGGEQPTPSGSNVSQQTSVSGTTVTPQQTQVGVQQPTPSGSNVSQQTSVSGTTVTPQQTQVGGQQPTPSGSNVSQQTTPVRQPITNYVFCRYRKTTVVDDEIQMTFSLVFVHLLIRCEVVM